MSKPAEKETTPPVEKEKGAEEKADEVKPSTDDAEVKKGDEEPSKTAASPQRLKDEIKAARETEETSLEGQNIILEAEVKRLKNKIAKIKGLLSKDSGFVDSSDDEVDAAKPDGKDTNGSVLDRPLTAAESMGLAEEAIVALIGRLGTAAVTNLKKDKDLLSRAVEAARAKQPYLNVCIQADDSAAPETKEGKAEEGKTEDKQTEEPAKSEEQPTKEEKKEDEPKKGEEADAKKSEEVDAKKNDQPPAQEGEEKKDEKTAAADGADLGAHVQDLHDQGEEGPQYSFKSNKENKIPVLETTLPMPKDGEDVKAALRTLVRDEMAKGVDKSVSLFRVVVVSVEGDQETYVVPIGNHVCLDGRSFVIWLEDFMDAVLNGDDAIKKLHSAEMLPFVDWMERIPYADLEGMKPFEPSEDEVQLAPSVDPIRPPEELMADVPQTVVVDVPEELFSKVKATAKEHDCRLNAPLLTAFSAGLVDRAASSAAADAAAADGPCKLRTGHAVNLRPHVTPALPDNFMNNSFTVMQVTTKVAPKASKEDLWAATKEVQASVQSGLEGNKHEAFRTHEIMQRMAFDEFGPLFSVPFLWSNIGHVPDDLGLSGIECHIHGSAMDPVLTVHCIETCGRLAVTITYPPGYHEQATIADLGQRFLERLKAMC